MASRRDALPNSAQRRIPLIGPTLTPGRFVRWRSAVGLDFHVLSTLLFRGWALIAGAATVLVLPLWLPPIEQGYYYTFGSVLALQIFFELGLNQIIMQLVSHEMAHLQTDSEGRLSGDRTSLSRLGGLARMVRRWYTVAALLYGLVVGVAGIWFFEHKGSLPAHSWVGVWLVLIGSTATNLWCSPSLAMLEGCGHVGHVARLRLVQSVIGYIVFWIALALGAKLWSVVVLPIVGAFCTLYWLRLHRGVLHAMTLGPIDSNAQLRWRIDVFPLQWRVAVSWISGYFIFNLFTPLVFSRQGAVEAGRLGMALTVFSAMSTIGMSWVNAKAPLFTTFIARRDRHALNALFKAATFRSMAFITSACMLVVVVASILAANHHPVMARIAAPAVLMSLALVTVVNSWVFAAATYMRAHREEPMLPISVVSAALVAGAAFYGLHFGVPTAMALYAAISLLLTLPWTAWLFVGYFRRDA